MKAFAKAAGLLALTVTVSVAAIATAQAGAFGLNEYNAISTGNAMAGAAAGGAGVGSMVFNPATMTDFSGAWGSQTFTYIDPDITVKSPVFGNTNDIGNGGRLVPAGQGLYQINNQLWVGLEVGAPFGLVTDVKPQYWAAYDGQVTSVFSVIGTPMLAYKVNDMLSFGAGVEIGYVRARLSKDISPLAPGSWLDLDGDDMGAAYKVGFTLKPIAGTKIGVGYRSQMFVRESGSLQVLGIPAIPGLSGPIMEGVHPMHVGLMLPDQLNVGLRQQLTNDLTLGLTYQWTDWSKFSQTVAYVDGVPGLPLVFDYRNGFLISGGLDYRLNDKLTLRAGVEWEQSPIYDAIRQVSLPDADRTYLGVGASYQINPQMSVDFAYAHVFTPNAPINILPGNIGYVGVPFVGAASTSVNMVSATFNMHFDKPAPLIAKY